MNTLLWVVFPYVCLTVFVVGHFWRYKYDQFGWTTRSSQLYEDRLLRWGSPMFHFGILFVVLGHVMGLLIPKSWTEAVGISQEIYHFLAVSVGLLAGFLTLGGLAILIYRRRVTGPVFSATTPMDKVMYVFLAVTILLGLANTLGWHAPGINNPAVLPEHYNYRDGVSVWYRQFLTFRPDADLMAQAPLGFQLHTLVACLLFALWPFTRLVHVFSAPVGYLTRPYVVYRSADRRPGTGVGTQAPRRGWESRPELRQR
ncbi:nitrate reductase gamma subunit [Austwickia chelonae]|uniref:Nitrate reductase-like protein NarX n=1 Tax=Austwickia chelonae NBRC 105200 TaxID=1184607 RepID=K6VPQ2_9MICO|nr:respiratory nitrate reductase subunit gamma [Austwickia chelonae]GAB78719.1 nitrate reductase gamma subunit [Austwickia chelonae NBRC 105200]SEW35019.1 nitrate reductase gamma subunit [Austwickia chelonae]